jgi:hypothetical protein
MTNNPEQIRTCSEYMHVLHTIHELGRSGLANLEENLIQATGAGGYEAEVGFLLRKLVLFVSENGRIETYTWVKDSRLVFGMELRS